MIWGHKILTRFPQQLLAVLQLSVQQSPSQSKSVTADRWFEEVVDPPNHSQVPDTMLQYGVRLTRVRVFFGTKGCKKRRTRRIGTRTRGGHPVP